MQHQSDDCKVYCAMLFDYVSDLLSDEEKADLLSHLDICPDCKEELLKIQAIIGAAQTLPEVEVPDGLRESVAEQISDIANKPKHRNIYTLRRFASVALPLAACAVLAIGIYSNGLLDSFVNSDDILSSAVSTETETLQSPTYTDETPTAENVTPTTTQSKNNGSAHIKSDTSSKNKTEVKSETPANNPIPEDVATDNATAVSEAVQNDVSTDTSDDSENFVAPAMPAPVSAGSAAEETDKIAAYNSRGAMSYPVSCTIITFDLSAFAARFGGDAANNVINTSVSADNIDALMDFAAKYAVEISFEYSPEYSDTISVTAQTKE